MCFVESVLDHQLYRANLICDGNSGKFKSQHALHCTYLQEDDGVVAGVLHEELLEVGGAGREDHLVALDRRPVAGDGHVAERLGLVMERRRKECINVTWVVPSAQKW